MPMHDAFRDRLLPMLPEITACFGTPFHIYDEAGIRGTIRQLSQAFAGVSGFREYFAVKALPNPEILRLVFEAGFGFDCSSPAELELARRLGASGDDISFTSTNTSMRELELALADGGCILNMDDLRLLDRLEQMRALPDVVSFRHNPGVLESSNQIIGAPLESKFGLTREQIMEGCRRAVKLGVKRLGIHAMVVSNERDYRQIVRTSALLLDLAGEISEALHVQFDFVNIGGGLGIPYRPEETPLDLQAMAEEIAALVRQYEARHGDAPKLYMESGRYLTGPHGVLVTEVINRKETYRTYIGVDANMSALMRPGMYGAYHHISVCQRDQQSQQVSDVAPETVDVVGSLCENNDKFAIQRPLPRTQPGDLLIIHDTGAHGHAMGFNYNGRLRPQELLLREDGSVHLIRRQETLSDYFATLDFEPRVLK